MSMRPLGSCATRSVKASRRPEAPPVGPTRPSSHPADRRYALWRLELAYRNPTGREAGEKMYQRVAEGSPRLWGKNRFILPTDHMAQVGPGPLPLFDQLDLVSDAVLCTLLLSGNRLVVHRTHPQPDSLWKHDGGCLSQFDGLRKHNAHAVVRHIDDLPRDQAVQAIHLTGHAKLAPWIQPFEALVFRHCRDLDSPKGFVEPNLSLQYHHSEPMQSGKTLIVDPKLS